MQRYRRKPQPPGNSDQFAARYEPGGPLNALAAVARMADGRAEMAEVALPSGTVLLVRWSRIDDAGAVSAEYEVVEASGYLAYSSDSYFLYVTDDADLEQFYEPAH